MAKQLTLDRVKAGPPTTTQLKPVIMAAGDEPLGK